MRCLVTGGAGFIGRWLVARLLEEGSSVVALDDLSNGRPENLRDLLEQPKLTFVEGDVRDRTAVARLFDGEPFDLVYHLAGSTRVQRSIDAPYESFDNDTRGSLHVLEAARALYFRLNGLDATREAFDSRVDLVKLVDRRPRVTLVSTCMAYDLAGDAPIAEEHPLRAPSPYVAAKLAADLFALSYAVTYRMPVTVARLFNVYGPFQKSTSEGGVIPAFLKRDLAGERLMVKGTGLQTRDFLYVDDCVDFLRLQASSARAEGEVLNVGTGVDIAIRELATLCSTDGKIDLVAHDHPQAEVMRLVCDAAKGKRLLGWAPRTSLAEGLAKTKSWLGANRWAW